MLGNAHLGAWQAGAQGAARQPQGNSGQCLSSVTCFDRLPKIVGALQAEIKHFPKATLSTLFFNVLSEGGRLCASIATNRMKNIRQSLKESLLADALDV